MDWKLELIVVPVSDVDRAKSFYIENTGFELNVDHGAGGDFACSIAVMRNLERSGSVMACI